MDLTKQTVNLSVEPVPQIDRTPVAVEPAPQPEPSTENPVVPEPVVIEPAPVLVVPPTNEAVDEFGVPWKNRYMEQRRKNEEVIEKLPQIIDEKLSRVTQTQPQQPTYTFEQLEAYKLQNSSDPNIVSWATGEQRKMQQAENKKLFEEVVTGREKISKTEIIKERSLIQVQNEYPDAFNHDAQGRPISWNVTAPITQHIFEIMKDPRFSNEPDGLVAAAERAYGKVAKSQIPTLQAKTQQAKADVKQAQKASLTEGAGRRVVPNAPPQQVAIENLRKTGSVKDASNAIGELLRQRGILAD